MRRPPPIVRAMYRIADGMGWVLSPLPWMLLLCVLCASCVRHRSPYGKASTVVIVVRHAEKDTVPPEDPELTAAGVARANTLVTQLAHAHVQAIIATQLVRSQETAQPIAMALGLPIETIRRTADIAAHARAVAEAVRRHRGKTVLVVAHGETVGPILAALGGPKVHDLCAAEYSNLFTLILDASSVRLVRSLYGAPSPGPESCASTPE